MRTIGGNLAPGGQASWEAYVRCRRRASPGAAGVSADGMPALNLSVVGLPGEDARVLALAHPYERQSRRFVAPPR